MSQLVSILIPVYNRAALIAETLDSALAQTYPNIEVVVVDNASTDGTWEVINDYANRDPRIKPYRNDTNIGPVRNWKRCVDEARGEYGKILWSDDLIAPEFVAKALELFDEDTGFVYSAVGLFSHQPGDGYDCYRIGESGHYPTADYIARTMPNDNVPVSPGCAIFRLADLQRNLLVDIENKINIDFATQAIGNDLLLFLLTANSYPKFGFLTETLSFFRMHAGSITIAAESGKIPLHYMMAKGYFVDRCRPEMRLGLAERAFRLLLIFPNHGDYGIRNVNDFFSRPVHLSALYRARMVTKYTLSRLAKTLKRALKPGDKKQPL